MKIAMKFDRGLRVVEVTPGIGGTSRVDAETHLMKWSAWGGGTMSFRVRVPPDVGSSLGVGNEELMALCLIYGMQRFQEEQEERLVKRKSLGDPYGSYLVDPAVLYKKRQSQNSGHSPLELAAVVLKFILGVEMRKDFPAPTLIDISCRFPKVSFQQLEDAVDVMVNEGILAVAGPSASVPKTYKTGTASGKYTPLKLWQLADKWLEAGETGF